MRKRIDSLISIVLSLVIAIGVLAVPVKSVEADTKYYTATVGGRSYGTYEIYDNGVSLSQAIRSQMISRVKTFNFYYLDYSGKTTISDFGDCVESACVYDGTPNGGDYLANSYLRFSVTTTRFRNTYYVGNKSIDLCLVSYTLTYYDNASEEQYVQNQITSIINSLGISNLSDYEKTLAIYNWITSNVTYDYANASNMTDYRTLTPYNAIAKNTAVCQGIATLFYRMLISVGVDNRITYNTNHCWNIVRIDGNYYYCDATWDLGYNPKYYDYFLKGRNSSFENDHDFSDLSSNRGYTISNNDYKPIKPNSMINDFVNRLYLESLGRYADDDGLKYWSNELAYKRIDGAMAARSFINSKEFKDKNLSNTDYLAVLYRVFFNRDMDEGGKNYWLSQLNMGMSRENVLEGFVGSPEWTSICTSYQINPGSAKSIKPISVPNATPVPTAVVTPVPVDVVPNDNVYSFSTRMYSCALNRNPDPSGLEYWSTELANRRISGTTLAYRFFFSQEFIDSNVSNEEFVNRLYRVFLDREPDAAGYSYWIASLENGSTRVDVFNGFSLSPEFVDICKVYGIDR